MNRIDLQNRTAVVTGGARGIGRGIGRAIAERLLDSGAKVSLWDVDPAALVVGLCSEDCSFTTAAVFDLSGGRATY